MEPKKKVSRILVDTNSCIGSGTCVVLAPDALELNADGVAVVKPGAETVELSILIESARSCPTQAILLLDENGEKIPL